MPAALPSKRRLSAVVVPVLTLLTGLGIGLLLGNRPGTTPVMSTLEHQFFLGGHDTLQPIEPPTVHLRGFERDSPFATRFRCDRKPMSARMLELEAQTLKSQLHHLQSQFEAEAESRAVFRVERSPARTLELHVDGQTITVQGETVTVEQEDDASQ